MAMRDKVSPEHLPIENKCLLLPAPVHDFANETATSMTTGSLSFDKSTRRHKKEKSGVYRIGFNRRKVGLYLYRLATTIIIGILCSIIPPEITKLEEYPMRLDAKTKNRYLEAWKTYLPDARDVQKRDFETS